MDRICLEALKCYILRLTDTTIVTKIGWVHLQIVFKMLNIGSHKMFDQHKRHVADQLRTGMLRDQVRI